ncbi:MAG: hypothetical protein KY437_08435 [Actinobacteria bacterium]|nr:hypothetical protein [Actinomycetota bacterium]
MATIRFPASDGVELDGDLRFPEDADEHGAVAVVCHPHPSYGGSMDSWMIPVLQSALVEDGWVVLRFDFRALHDFDGTGGLADVAGAVDRVLEHRADDAPVLLLGWSFGAAVSLRFALDDERVGGWAGVALPIDMVEGEAIRDRLGTWEAPKLFLHGSGDELTAVPDIEAFVEDAAEPKRLLVIEGGDHFLTAYADTLTGEVVGFARRVRGADDEDDQDEDG